MWNNPFLVNLNTFHLRFKHKAIDVFKQTWYNDVNNSRSLIWYKSLKQSSEPEQKAIDVFKQTWYNDVKNSRSLIWYRSLKQSFELN